MDAQKKRDGRLKPVRNEDPLASVGLPSKGDTSLHDPHEQERFLGLIVARDRLIDSTASSVTDTPRTLTDELSNLTLSSGDAKATVQSQAVRPPKVADNDLRIHILHHALRALRESLTATHRVDAFAQEAYLAIVRIGVKHRAWETYLPTLLQLLRVLRRSPKLHLKDDDVGQCLQLEILDLACRQDDLHGAFEKWSAALRWANTKKDVDFDKIGSILRSLIHGNAVLFWRTYIDLDAQLRGVVDYVASRIRRDAMATLHKAYFTVTLRYAEVCFGLAYEDAVKELDLRWEIEGDGDGRRVVIRRPRALAAGSHAQKLAQ